MVSQKRKVFTATKHKLLTITPTHHSVYDNNAWLPKNQALFVTQIRMIVCVCIERVAHTKQTFHRRTRDRDGQWGNINYWARIIV